MRYFVFFVFVFVFSSHAGSLADTGALPTWIDLYMTESDYFFLSGLSGLLCGILFSFLITK